ncbi:Endoplasmic reticulum resident protein 27, partial [Spheniscus mendiculus]
STAEKPILLNNITDAEAFISGAEVVVVGFFQVPASPWLKSVTSCGGTAQQLCPFGWFSYRSMVACFFSRMVVTVGVFACLQVDNDRRDLDMNSKDVDAEKMTRFVRMNELRLVTEYNPVTAIGVMQSSLQLHLLLITDKMSPKHPKRMRKYQAAAELFKGKV